MSKKNNPIMHCSGCNLTLLNKSFWNQFTYDNPGTTEEDVRFEMYQLPCSFIAPLVFLYGVVVVISFCGNIVVFYTICDVKGLHTVTNFFIANLSISDILMTVLCIPTTIVSDIIFKHWVMGSFMCPVLHYLQLVVVMQRAFAMVAITCDRHFLMSNPLKKRMTKPTARLLVILLWLAACIIALPTAMFSQIHYLQYEPGSYGLCIEIWETHRLRNVYSIIIQLLQYVIPLIIMICAYIHIGYMIWIKPTPGEAIKERDKRIALSKRKSLKMLFTLVSVYAITWLPIHIITTIADLNPTLYDHRFAHILWLFFHWLAFSNTGINPMVYCWVNKAFQKKLRLLLHLPVGNRRKSYKEQKGYRLSNGKCFSKRRREAFKEKKKETVIS
ncbi:neuropeptide Y receptor [Mytilus galloprovincialis]|uniref:Neuropeptide Y receptor n=1 Tax=Mytilus galloprovincialis TaxID=29158 RepID=A0A8B6E3D1_MYTGA|nr:neuropeptide Y receptor [Mytilus galloprovincialis]